MRCCASKSNLRSRVNTFGYLWSRLSRRFESSTRNTQLSKKEAKRTSETRLVSNRKSPISKWKKNNGCECIIISKVRFLPLSSKEKAPPPHFVANHSFYLITGQRRKWVSAVLISFPSRNNRKKKKDSWRTSRGWEILKINLNRSQNVLSVCIALPALHPVHISTSTKNTGNGEYVPSIYSKLFLWGIHHSTFF